MALGAVNEALRRWRDGAAARATEDEMGVSERAGCAFGLVTRRAVEDLEHDLRRVEAKIDSLLIGVAASILLEIWRAFSTGRW
jgi:hypothetical protein